MQFLNKEVTDYFAQGSEKDILLEGTDIFLADAIQFIRETASTSSMMLDIGGSRGYVLDIIAKQANLRKLYNCELVPSVYGNQVNADINLMGGDALQLPFKDSSFDYVLISNVLHHLVGKTRKTSLSLAKKAISEIKRVTKQNGYFIIFEQYNFHKLFAATIFYLTLLFSFFNIGFKSFGWRSKVIVSYMTPQEIENITSFDSSDKSYIIHKVIFGISMSKRYKYTLLLADTGFVLLIVKNVKK